MKKVLYLLTLPVFALALSCSCDRSAAADDERLPSITGEDNDKEVIYEKDERMSPPTGLFHTMSGRSANI